MRIIRVDSQTYRAYKIDTPRSESEAFIHFSDFSPVSSDWARINRSKAFTLQVVEGNPQKGVDYKANFAQIKGLPTSHFSPIENNLATGWFYSVKGIYYLEDNGEDRYRIECFMAKQGEAYSYASIALDIQRLEKHDYKLYEEVHYGD